MKFFCHKTPLLYIAQGIASRAIMYFSQQHKSLELNHLLEREWEDDYKQILLLWR